MGSYISQQEQTNVENIELKTQNDVIVQGDGLITQGCLYKQPVSNIQTPINPSRWKKRFFVLNRLSLSYYDIYGQEMFDLKNLSHVEMGELCLTTYSNSGYKILLQFLDGTLLTFASPSKRMAQTWVDKLNSILEKKETEPCLTNDDCLLDVGDKHDNFVFQLLYPQTMWENWYYRHLFVDVCKKQLFVRDLRLLNNFSLSNCTVCDVLFEGCANVISVTNSLTGRILYLMSESEEILRIWKQNIEQRCLHLFENTDFSAHNMSETNMIDFYNKLHFTLENGDCLSGSIICEQTGDSPFLLQHQTNFEQTKLEQTKFVEVEKGSADIGASRGNTNNKPKFLILSFDGGGVRGILPALLLERIVEMFPDFLKNVCMVTGTSNGSLISMGLAFGQHPQTLREMTELISKHVFSEQQTRYTVSTAKWSNRYLSVFCKEVWKNKKMSESFVPCLVPSFSLTQMKVEVNTSFSHFDQTEDSFVSDVVMKSCSAPTFFPAWKGSVDGGMFAHCPADLAIVSAMRDLKIPLEDIYVLSFSTGKFEQTKPFVEPSLSETVDEVTHNFGYYQWMSHLPTVLWEGMIEKSVFVCKQLIGERFVRVEPQLKKEYPLDKPEVIPELHALAKETNIDEVCNWIKINFC